jgi:divalent metal cation (Fe/Co/Zn/Cd) transporter
MSNIDVIKDYSLEWWQRGDLFKLRDLLNLSIILGFGVYFFGNLNMADKIFTFIISGKIVGTSYVLSFEQICAISALIISSMLARSIYSYLKNEKNRSKIKLRIKEAGPFSLNIRISA